MKRSIRWVLFALLGLSLATAGCGLAAAPVAAPPPAYPTPNLLMTIQALQSLVPPAQTPVPPAPPAPTAAPAPAICTGTNQANLLSVSVANRTFVSAGSAFTMTWTLQNVGSCTWTPSYSLVFDGGNPMNGPSAQAIGTTVAPGGSTAVSVSLVAPSTAGTYVGWWKLSTPWGVRFGIGNGGATDFSVTINTGTSGVYPPYPYPYPYPQPVYQPYYYYCNSGGGSNVARFISETVPDGTYIAPGAAFTKSWTLENIGSCTWTTSYSLVFDGGVQMGAQTQFAMPGTVPPGYHITLYVGMVAPSGVGHYTGYWKLMTPTGLRFGLGANGTGDFWVSINTGTWSWWWPFHPYPPYPGYPPPPPPPPTPRGYCWGPNGWYACAW